MGLDSWGICFLVAAVDVMINIRSPLEFLDRKVGGGDKDDRMLHFW